MKNQHLDYKLGLYYNNELLPLTTVNLNIQIINKYVNIKLVQVYKNLLKEALNSTFYIPKEIILIFKSLKISYNNISYEGIISNKSKKNIIYSKDNCLKILEYNKNRKKYIFFDLNDIQPEQEIKIELNYIDLIEPEDNSYKYRIDNIFIQKNSDNKLFYDYKYILNIINTKKIYKIFCNKNTAEISKIKDNEYLIKYNGIQQNDNINHGKLIISYEIEEENEPDIIVMKHPIYKNDYLCNFSLNLKNIIKENKIEGKEISNKDEYIVIIINNSAGNLKGVIKSIVYLLKSLPEKNCKFNILQNKPFFQDFINVNEDNIKKAINLLETYDYYKDFVAFTINNIKLIKPKKHLINKVFILGEELYYFDFKKLAYEIDNFIDSKCTIYTIFFPQFYIFDEMAPKQMLEQIKYISKKTNGNWALYNNKEEISDKVIKLYEESFDDYISNLKINFQNKDDNLKLFQKEKEKYTMNSKIDLLINMSVDNELKISFDYKEKKYEFEYDIILNNAKNDDMLHKIFYYEYYQINIYLQKELLNTLNKYQILTNLNELYIEPINNEEILESKINKKREKNLIFEIKGEKLNFVMKYLKNEKNDIELCDGYTIKEIKIINDLITGISYKEQRYIMNGKCLENERLLIDYGDSKFNKIIHVPLRKEIFCQKNYFNLNENINIYLIIKNQKINGLWEANENNIKILKKAGLFFEQFYEKVKIAYSLDNRDIIFTLLIITFLKSFPFKYRYKFILQKAINLLKDNIDYNEDMQRKINNFIYLESN